MEEKASLELNIRVVLIVAAATLLATRIISYLISWGELRNLVRFLDELLLPLTLSLLTWCVVVQKNGSRKTDQPQIGPVLRDWIPTVAILLVGWLLTYR